jgi:transposase-like protein
MKNPNHPGDIIRDCLDEPGVSVTDGARAHGVTRSALSRLSTERRTQHFRVDKRQLTFYSRTMIESFKHRPCGTCSNRTTPAR